MAIILDEDFQSYALGALPPYGNLVKLGVANAVIEAGGIFGDAKKLSVPAFQCLQWPGAVHSPLDTYYQQATIIFGFQVTAADLSENGELLQLSATQNSGFNNAVLTLKVMTDGTLAFTTENQLFIYAISDFSLLTNQWYWFQINVSFSSVLGQLAYTADVAINGLVVLSVTNNLTGLTTANYPTAGFNYLALGGCGLGNALGRLTIYSVIQAIGTSPHPGTPVALVTQGVIELLTSTVPGPTPPIPPPGPPPGPPIPGPGGCAEQSKLSVQPGLSSAGTALPSFPGQTNSLKSQL